MLPCVTAVYEHIRIDISEDQDEDEYQLNWSRSNQSCLCGGELVCIECHQLGSLTTVPLDIPETILETSPVLPCNIIDLQMQEDHMIAVTETGTMSISKKHIKINDYDHVLRSSKDWFPLAYVPSQKKALSDYRSSNVIASGIYGHAAGPKRLHRKIIVDNDIRFSVPKLYTVISLDIETYNDEAFSTIPLKESARAHIGIICLSIRQGTSVVKHAFVNDRRYHIVSEEAVVLHRCITEQHMCIEVLSLIASIKGIVFLLTFNGSASLFSDDCGYDIPWIMNRSGTRLRMQSKPTRIDDEGRITGAHITNIGLPNVFLIDLAEKLAKCTPQDKKNEMPSYSLDSYLAAYSLPSKLDHDYIDLQKRLATPGSDITDIVSYCTHDANILLRLLDTSAVLAKSIALVQLLQIPLSYAVYHTDANALELWLQRQYTSIGHAVCYYESDIENSGYRGAYCETIAKPGRIYTEVISPDFASLYPNATRSINGCLTTWQSESSEDCITVDTSDDVLLGMDTVSFSRGPSVIPKLLGEMFTERKRIKETMKQEVKDSPLYIAASTLQLAVKIVLNTLYGLTGNSRSPLFWKSLAAAITSYARRCTTTARDILMKRGHTFLGADTDSCFVSLAVHINNQQDLVHEMEKVNEEICVQMSSPFLTMEIEEVIRRVCFMDGRKSYVCLQDEGLLYKQWTRDAPLCDETEADGTYKLKLKIRGISWSKQDKRMKIVTNDHIRSFLSGDVSAEDFHKLILDRVTESIDTAIRQGDIEQLVIYAERVKMTSEKSALVAYLKSSYAAVIQDQSYVQVFLLKGQGSKTFRKIPIQCVSTRLTSLLDRDDIIATAMSSLTKMLLTANQKKGLTSQFREQLDQQKDEISNTEILVRLETLTVHGKTRYRTERWQRDSVAARLSKIGNTTAVHEILTGSLCRLFFDVDGTHDTLEYRFIELDRIVHTELGFLPMRRTLRSDGSKISAHVFYDVTISISYARHIATIAKRSIPEIDTGVYGTDHSLRLPNSIKINTNEIVHRRFVCSFEAVKNHFISPDDTMQFVSQPLHTIDEQIIDSFYQGRHTIGDADTKLVAKWCSQNKIPCDLIHKGHAISIIARGSYLCPLHNRFHQNENLWSSVSSKNIIIGCHRLESHEKHLRIKLPRIQSETLDKIQEQIELSSSMNRLNGAILQDNQYLSLDITKELQGHEIVCIRSQLGTGKSEALSKALEHWTQPVLIVSHRLTFTADIKNRYGAIAYNDIQGSLNLETIGRLICQVESLSRVRQAQGCLLILDEVESLLTQLTNQVSFVQQGHLHLTNLIQQAGKIIAMDGFLQQHTVSLLESIKKQPVKTIQNTFSPYRDHRITVKTYSPACQQDVINDIERLLKDGKRVVSSCTSNILATAIVQHFKEEYKTALYTGTDYQRDEHGLSMFEKKQQDLANVNDSWKVDLLVHTSTITSGVNFSQDWFDCRVDVFCSQTCDAMSFIQSTGRVRSLSEKEHILWFQPYQTQPAISPLQRVYGNDSTLYHRDNSQQLLLWARCRRDAIECYRSSIVFSSLKELGFTLSQQSSIGLGRVTNSDQLFLMTTVTQSDVMLFDAIQKDKRLHEGASLTTAQVKKIVFLRRLHRDPTEAYNDEHIVKQIMKQQVSLKISQRITAICQGNVDAIEDVLRSDWDAAMNGVISKRDITTTNDFLEPVRLNLKYRALLAKGIFTSDDLPEDLRGNSRAIAVLQRAAAVDNNTVVRTDGHRTKHKKTSIFTVKPLVI